MAHVRESRMSPVVYILRIMRDTTVKWIADDGFILGAALAYYSLFSIAPLLVIVLAVVSMIFGAEAASGELEHQLTGYFGPGVARSIQNLLNVTRNNETGNIITVVAWAGALLFGATSVFAQLKIALNRIWKVETPRHTGIKRVLFARLLALGMVAIVALLLMGSVIVSTALGQFTNYATAHLPISPAILYYLDLAVSMLLLSLLFAAIFRFLPDVRIGWRHVILGAVVTSALFVLGKFGISLYLTHGAVASGYGAASSLLLLLLWIYYSSMIFFFGAEFTYVYSRVHHLPAKPIDSDDETQPDQ